MAAMNGASPPQTNAAEWSSASIPAEDMIDFFKIIPCPQTGNHNWSTCFCAHPNEKARRRSLADHQYHAIFCVEMLSKGQCKSGDNCNLAHSVFEYWVHPEKFRTKFCKDGSDCKRAVCFFAHSREELREPSPQYEGRRVTDGISQQIQDLANSLSAAQSSSTIQSHCSISSPGSQSSSNTMPCLPGFAYEVPDAAAAQGYSPAPFPAAANTVPVYIVSGNTHTPVTGVAAMQQQSCFSPLQSSQSQQQQQQQQQQPGASSADSLPVMHVMQPPMLTVSSHAAAQLAALQLRYDQLLNKAEEAAARAEAATNVLQATVAALGVPAAAAATTYSSSMAPGKSTAELFVQQAPGHISSNTVELPAVTYIPMQQPLSAAASTGYCHPGVTYVTDPASFSGVTTYTVGTPVSSTVATVVSAPQQQGMGYILRTV